MSLERSVAVTAAANTTAIKGAETISPSVPLLEAVLLHTNVNGVETIVDVQAMIVVVTATVSVLGLIVSIMRAVMSMRKKSAM